MNTPIIRTTSPNRCPDDLFYSCWFENELSLLFADTNVGKSILAVQIAFHVAENHPNDIVLYIDYKLSEQRFYMRYSNQETGEVYNAPDNFLRAEVDRSQLDLDNLENCSFEGLQDAIKDTNAKYIILDNMTSISSNFIARLLRLKNECNVSILVLAHTRKRNLWSPLTINDLSGSKKLMDLCDSAFTIGKSNKGKDIRYLKQIKSRSEIIYGEDNVIEFIKEFSNNRLWLRITGNGNEYEHLLKLF